MQLSRHYLHQFLIPTNALIKHDFLNTAFNDFLLEHLLNTLLHSLTIHVYEHKKPYVNHLMIPSLLNTFQFFQYLLTKYL